MSLVYRQYSWRAQQKQVAQQRRMQALLVKPHMQSLSRALPTSFTAMINLTKLKLSGITKGYKPGMGSSVVGTQDCKRSCTTTALEYSIKLTE